MTPQQAQGRMRALLLAAGFGKRLAPLTLHTPKPLVAVNGLPLILYNLALLKKHGITDVVINLHYLSHAIRRFLGNGKKLGFTIRYSLENPILGTGGGVRKACPYFDSDFLVLNSDTISDINLTQIIKQHKNSNNVATLALRQHADDKAYGRLYFRGKKLISILEKPKNRTSHSHYTGVCVLNKKRAEKTWQHIPLGHEFCIFRQAFIPALKAGQPFGAFEQKGYWNDCGTLAALAKSQKYLSQKNHALSYQEDLGKLKKLIFA
jgi:NDP-sugar pyrophosphorylase family protein